MSIPIREYLMALLSDVPRPPDTALPPGATEAALVEFESKSGLRLPAELKEWLRTCNAPCVGPGGLYGVAPAPRWLSIQEHLSTEPDWLSKGWIPVAGDGNGNYYVLDSHTGAAKEHPIYFLDHERSLSAPAYVVASNLWQFLLFLLQKELDGQQGRTSWWPFDQTRVLTADPGLAQYANVASLPWESE